MRKFLLLIIWIILLWCTFSYAKIWSFSSDWILTTDVNDAVDIKKNPNGEEIDDPLREWAYKIVNAEDGDNEIDNIIRNEDEISDHDDAINETLSLIKRIVNYALSMISFVALVYLLYHGFLIVTAAGDDTQYKKWLKGVKFAAIALSWIALSWLLVSFILWIINNILS